MLGRQTCGVERAQRGPRAVDVVHAPAAVPAAVLLLLFHEIGDAALHDLAGVAGRAELRQHGDAARRHVGRRRIEQRAVIGEGDVVEIVISVIGVERAPAAVAALQALDPFARPRDRRRIMLPGCAIHRHDDDRGVVDVGIMRVGVLERPSARPHVRTPHRPVALDVEHLQRFQPFETLQRGAFGLGAAGFEQCMGDERGVPHRRDAGLAIGLVVMNNEQALDRFARGLHMRIVRRVTEHVEHQEAVDHGRKDRAETVDAVETFDR